MHTHTHTHTHTRTLDAKETARFVLYILLIHSCCVFIFKDIGGQKKAHQSPLLK